MGLGWSGDISSYRMLTAPVVFINEPRLIQSLLVERAADYDKGKLQRYLFRPDAERALPRYAYLPFGAGHRVCIGSHFATMEGHLLLATIAHAALHAGGVRDAGRARVGPDAAPEPSHYGHRHAPLTALKKFAIIRYPYRPTATFGDYRP